MVVEGSQMVEIKSICRLRSAAEAVLEFECDRVNVNKREEPYDPVANPGQFDDRVVALACALAGLDDGVDYRIEPEEARPAIEIGSGAELDMSVAEVCGLSSTIYYDHELSENVCLLLPGEALYRPSVDLNAAFAAAERVGMFLELQRLADCWMATTHVLAGKSVCASTPALAICGAILEIAK